MTTPALWAKAASFAARAHRHQVRKDKTTPYIAHPFRVAMTVRHVFGCEDEVALCIALLHDVIEDTTTDYDDLATNFSAEIARGVGILTKDARLPEEEREARFYEAIAAGPWQVRLVKLADGYDNVTDCFEEAQRAKAVLKARHAIAAAGDDPRLVKAKQALEALLAG
jgi:guanosine-3',5'-bis(diphosphate) 3'-pyrophosphohydrolase